MINNWISSLVKRKIYNTMISWQFYNDRREETYYIVSYNGIKTLTLKMLVIITNNLQIGDIVKKKKKVKIMELLFWR